MFSVAQSLACLRDIGSTTRVEPLDIADGGAPHPLPRAGLVLDPPAAVCVEFYARASDQQALVDALKDGIRLSDRKAAAKAAGDWIALVYGRQLQKPEDEKAGTSDPLDVASMPREERARLARELAEQHPALAARIMGTRPSD